MDASEIHPRRVNAKEVLITHKDGENLYFLWQMDGSAKLSERDYEFQEPTLKRESTARRERISAENLKVMKKSFNLKKQKMSKKSMRTFSLFNGISSIVITMNLEFNFSCREKNIPCFH